MQLLRFGLAVQNIKISVGTDNRAKDSYRDSETDGLKINFVVYKCK